MYIREREEGCVVAPLRGVHTAAAAAAALRGLRYSRGGRCKWVSTIPDANRGSALASACNRCISSSCIYYTLSVKFPFICYIRGNVCVCVRFRWGYSLHTIGRRPAIAEEIAPFPNGTFTANKCVRASALLVACGTRKLNWTRWDAAYRYT